MEPAAEGCNATLIFIGRLHDLTVNQNAEGHPSAIRDLLIFLLATFPLPIPRLIVRWLRICTAHPRNPVMTEWSDKKKKSIDRPSWELFCHFFFLNISSRRHLH